VLALAPNPARAAAVVGYSLPAAGEATLRLLSLDGSLAQVWPLGERPAGDGRLSVRLDTVAPGIYILALGETMHGHAVLVARFKVVVLR